MNTPQPNHNILPPQKAKEKFAEDKLLEFAQYVDEFYGTTYEGDNGSTLTNEELLKEWLSKK